MYEHGLPAAVKNLEAVEFTAGGSHVVVKFVSAHIGKPEVGGKAAQLLLNKSCYPAECRERRCTSVPALLRYCLVVRLTRLRPVPIRLRFITN